MTRALPIFVPVAEYLFPKNSRQAEIAARYNVELVFRFRYTYFLPVYLQEAIKEMGYRYVMLGRTTYQHSIWGLYKEVPE